MRLGSAVRDGHLRKLRGFYVDYRDGTILSLGQVSAAEAQQIIDGARALLDDLGLVLQGKWTARRSPRASLASRDTQGLLGDSQA